MAAGSGDHSINKIALYSALFAGVAYVGYSCVKDAFSRGSSSLSKGRQNKNHKIYRFVNIFYNMMKLYLKKHTYLKESFFLE